jgi:hypothetical protein
VYAAIVVRSKYRNKIFVVVRNEPETGVRVVDCPSQILALCAVRRDSCVSLGKERVEIGRGGWRCFKRDGALLHSLGIPQPFPGWAVIMPCGGHRRMAKSEAGPGNVASKHEGRTLVGVNPRWSPQCPISSENQNALVKSVEFSTVPKLPQPIQKCITRKGDSVGPGTWQCGRGGACGVSKMA